MRVGSAVRALAAPDTAGVARSHFLAVSGGIVWCRNCGLYAEKRIRSLALPCNGVPGNGNKNLTSTERAQVRKICLLSRGLHPVSGKPVQLPVKPADFSAPRVAE